jgi:hypothetical protein
MEEDSHRGTEVQRPASKTGEWGARLGFWRRFAWRVAKPGFDQFLYDRVSLALKAVLQDFVRRRRIHDSKDQDSSPSRIPFTTFQELCDYRDSGVTDFGKRPSYNVVF